MNYYNDQPMKPADVLVIEWLYRCAEREAILKDGRGEVTPQERSEIIRQVDWEIQRIKPHEQIHPINPSR